VLSEAGFDNRREAWGPRAVALSAVISGLVLLPAVAVKMSNQSTNTADAASFSDARTHAARKVAATRPGVATPARPAPAPPAPAPLAYPPPHAVEAVGTYLSGRIGANAFAVIDERGQLSGYHMHQTFTSASVVKAMLMVAYLRALAAQRGTLGSVSQALLYPMIHTSDNSAASAIWRRVGDSGLQDVAQRAGMTEFSLGHDWANEQISPADQVRLFFRIDSLVPSAFRTYARSLLSTIETSESWGIPAVARPRWEVYFKGGWRRTGLGHLVHQVARLERPGHRLELAVMTDGLPSTSYGIETIRGATSLLLAGP
jgi:hypothetical protein